MTATYLEEGNKVKKTQIVYYLIGFVDYLLAILNFRANKLLGVTFFCLGSAMLVLGLRERGNKLR